ncbi:hypothetical protein BASA81_008694 [Batrachochytrium salamandrivorans]|nr:hypothetical protein BASA81_008694 [Batrachochytrium salamandrivorans]
MLCSPPMLLFLLLAVNAVQAYRDKEYIPSVSSNQICLGFLVNSSDEFHLSTEDGTPANAPCQHGVTPSSVDIPFYLFNYPKHIDFELRGHSSLMASAPIDYKATLLASWGGMLASDELVKFKCDANGDAVFIYSSLKKPTPQRMFTQTWLRNEPNTQMVGGFDLKLDLAVSGAAPMVGDGVLFSLAICPIGSSSTEETKRLYDVEMRLQIGFSWGDLHPTMWAEMILLIVVSIPKLALVVWFMRRCWMFKDHVMTQQKCFLFASTFSLASGLAYLLFLLIANQNGMDTTCCPAPIESSILVGFKFASNMVFDLLLLATCKGWGVVVSRLERSDVSKIAAYFVASMLVYLFSQLFGVSLEIAWLMVLIESGLWVWIFVSLNNTSDALASTGRLDRHAKLEMYASLRSILKRALALWVLVGVFVIVVVIYCYTKYNRLDAVLLVPSTLGWDATLLYLMVSFGYVWRPSPATAAFSYSFARRDDDNAYDMRDAVDQFGLETT